MIMADVLAITMVIIGLVVSLNALLLLCRGMWLEGTSDISALCAEGGAKNFVYGLVPTVVVVFLAIAIGGNAKKVGKFLAPAILSLFFLYSCIGLSGFVTMIGEKLIVDHSSAWKATIVGGASFSLACILPILGWFILLPYGLIVGCGAKLRLKSYQKSKRRIVSTTEDVNHKEMKDE